MNMKEIIQTINLAGQSIHYSTIILECSDGFTVSLCSLGASIRQIKVPSSKGVFQNIALSFASDRDYLSNPLYAGATLAPTAGRIANGHLTIGGHTYALSRNENDRHTLHGGFDNASFRSWSVESLHKSPHCARAAFTCTLPDGLDGFPGNRKLRAIYTLTEQDASCSPEIRHTLTLRCEAVSDKDTYLNLSNHTYFNLTGDFSRPADGHKLQIRADHYLRNTPDFIPEAIAPVDHSPFDFRQAASLQHQFHTYPGDLQLKRGQGYNHGFVLKHEADVSTPELNAHHDFSDQCSPVGRHDFSGPYDPAELLESSKAAQASPDLICSAPGSDWDLSITSDAPCMVFYSGGYIPQGLALADGQFSHPGCALAFEFQDFPDAPGGHSFIPYHPTAADRIWTRDIHYTFHRIPDAVC